MAGEQKIAAVDPKEPALDSHPAPPFGSSGGGDWQPLDFDRFAPDPTIPKPSRVWIQPALAILALVGWTAFYIWANLTPMAATRDPGMWAGWVSSWATPTLVIGVIWLIAMRSSQRETRRFLDASQLLAEETERLEARLLTTNRELSLAREFIAAQGRDLDSVGRIAVDRMSQHAERLQSLIKENSAQIEAIGTVSATALENMERLRGQLPVLTSAAKDLTNNFGNAGRAANAQVQELITGFNRITQFGQVSEAMVAALRTQIEHALAGFATQTEQLELATSSRLTALNGQAEAFHASILGHQAEFHEQLQTRTATLASEIAETRSRLDQEEAESIVSLRSRLAALRDETGAVARALRDGEGSALAHWREAVTQLEKDMREAGKIGEDIGRQAAATSNSRMAKLAEEAAALERVLSETGARFEGETARRRHAGEAQDRATIERLTSQLAALDEDISRRQAAHIDQLYALSSQSETATAALAAIEAQITTISQASSVAEAGMVQRLNLLGQRLSDSGQLLDATDRTLAGLTDNSVRLLELIQASATHSREDLALAIDKGAARLADVEARALFLRDTVSDADRRGESLSAYVLQAQNRLSEASVSLVAWHEDIHEKARAHGQTIAELTQSVAELDSVSTAAADRAQKELSIAINQLAHGAQAAVEQIETRGAASISGLAEQLGEESGDAIERAMRQQVTEISGKLEQAATRAAGISREATTQLRHQLTKVEEMLGNLESRVAEARSRAEEQVDNDFGRRVALITEALNSSAIDIAKALDTDVSDTAWSAYLRGDRGIFTRRAVRLLDAPEARSIAQLYENDRHFREHVSHYIHDFEAMLRELLSTRDGHALGVTLLSSDMGKLYVALAQAIERLRN